MNLGRCDKCGDIVHRSNLRGMGGGVEYCKDCYSGKHKENIKEVVKEVPTITVEVSEAPVREVPKQVIRKVKKVKSKKV